MFSHTPSLRKEKICKYEETVFTSYIDSFKKLCGRIYACIRIIYESNPYTYSMYFFQGRKLDKKKYCIR